MDRFLDIVEALLECDIQDASHLSTTLVNLAEDPFVKANAFNLGEEYDVIDVLSAYLDFDERSHLNDEKTVTNILQLIAKMTELDAAGTSINPSELQMITKRNCFLLLKHRFDLIGVMQYYISPRFHVSLSTQPIVIRQSILACTIIANIASHIGINPLKGHFELLNNLYIPKAIVDCIQFTRESTNAGLVSPLLKSLIETWTLISSNERVTALLANLFRLVIRGIPPKRVFAADRQHDENQFDQIIDDYVSQKLIEFRNIPSQPSALESSDEKVKSCAKYMITLLLGQSKGVHRPKFIHLIRNDLFQSLVSYLKKCIQNVTLDTDNSSQVDIFYSIPLDMRSTLNEIEAILLVHVFYSKSSVSDLSESIASYYSCINGDISPEIAGSDRLWIAVEQNLAAFVVVVQLGLKMIGKLVTVASASSLMDEENLKPAFQLVCSVSCKIMALADDSTLCSDINQKRILRHVGYRYCHPFIIKLLLKPSAWMLLPTILLDYPGLQSPASNQLLHAPKPLPELLGSRHVLNRQTPCPQIGPLALNLSDNDLDYDIQPATPNELYMPTISRVMIDMIATLNSNAARNRLDKRPGSSEASNPREQRHARRDSIDLSDGKANKTLEHEIAQFIRYNAADLHSRLLSISLRLPAKLDTVKPIIQKLTTILASQLVKNIPLTNDKQGNQLNAAAPLVLFNLPKKLGTLAPLPGLSAVKPLAAFTASEIASITSPSRTANEPPIPSDFRRNRVIEI